MGSSVPFACPALTYGTGNSDLERGMKKREDGWGTKPGCGHVDSLTHLPPTHQSTHPVIYLFIYLLAYLLTYLFIHLFTCSPYLSKSFGDQQSNSEYFKKTKEEYLNTIKIVQSTRAKKIVMGLNCVPPQNLCTELLTPSTSEGDLIWKQDHCGCHE